VNMPCRLVAIMISSGAGVQCPDNRCDGFTKDGAYVKFYAFSGGTAGYFKPTDIGQGVWEYNGQLLNAAGYQALVDQMIQQAQLNVALNVAKVTGQPVDAIHADLKFSHIRGGNVNFVSQNGFVDFGALDAGCPSGRCGSAPSLHIKNGIFLHLDTGNPGWVPLGTLLHVIADGIYGNLTAVPMSH